MSVADPERIVSSVVFVRNKFPVFKMGLRFKVRKKIETIIYETYKAQIYRVLDDI